jgi:hypothetical protein
VKFAVVTSALNKRNLDDYTWKSHKRAQVPNHATRPVGEALLLIFGGGRDKFKSEAEDYDSRAIVMRTLDILQK